MNSHPDAAAPEPTQLHPDPERSSLTEISNEIVRVFKNQFGRGPTSARASWAGPDTLTVVLEDTFTPAERNMARMGEHERLREMRMFFQYASIRELCEPVERITGRSVRAFVSGLDTGVHGLSVETFVLHPKGSTEPSRIERVEFLSGSRPGSRMEGIALR